MYIPIFNKTSVDLDSILYVYSLGVMQRTKSPKKLHWEIISYDSWNASDTLFSLAVWDLYDVNLKGVENIIDFLMIHETSICHIMHCFHWLFGIYTMPI